MLCRSVRVPRTALIVVAPLVLIGCLTVGAPRPGHPLETADDRMTVCGHLAIQSGTRDVPPLNPGADWASVGPGIHPELQVYLLRLTPRAVSTPAVLRDGLFCWHLTMGDYLLIGSPADDASAPPVAQRHWPLAAFRAASGPGVTCVGDLRVRTTGIVSVAGVPRMEFSVAAVDIADACTDRLREVEALFAPAVSTPRTQLLIDAADLSFEDPALVAAVRTRLDQAGAKTQR
jgi:hypothetical protein